MKKQKIEIPTHCPSCNSQLEQVNSQLFCKNNSCSAQSTKKIEAFVKKMKIKGLGPASISKLGFVRPIEMYENSLEYYVEVLGEKIGQKVFNEIENSRITTFATFLSALSIPLIGDTASKKIATVANSFYHLDRQELPIGQKACENLDNWYTQNWEEVENLEKNFIFQKIERNITDKGKVCITGKLNDFSNRTKAKEFLENQGYTVTNTISGKTDYLVCEDGSNSSKTKKAESLGIPIVKIVDIIEEK
jgi:NAD-dependent DNA ligase